MRRRSVWLAWSISPALCLSAGLALAEDPTSTVQKTPSSRGTIAPYEPGDTAKAPSEINPSAGDEGAGWDAAVEAAPGPTPLIGDEQTAAVQRIKAIESAP